MQIFIPAWYSLEPTVTRCVQERTSWYWKQSRRRCWSQIWSQSYHKIFTRQGKHASSTSSTSSDRYDRIWPVINLINRMESFRVVRQWTNLLCSSHEKSRSAEYIDYDVGVLERRQSWRQSLECRWMWWEKKALTTTHRYSPVLTRDMNWVGSP